MKVLKQIIIAICILCCFSIGLYADESLEYVRLRFITIKGDDPTYRYQVNSLMDGNWTVIDEDDPFAQWETLHKDTDHLFYQYSIDGKNWSDTIELSYKSSEDHWQATSRILQQQNSDFTLSLGGTFVKPLNVRDDVIYEHELGFGLRVDRAIGAFSVYLESSYLQGASPNDLIEKIHSGTAAVGAGYPVDLDLITLTPQVCGGIMLEGVVHKDFGMISCVEGFGKAGMNVSGDISERFHLFIDGGVIIFSGTDQPVVEAVLTLGTSVGL